MKIRKIKYNNHPVLRNLELDFVNQTTNQPYDTIVFAGENGTGKTSILESLSNFLNKKTFEPFERIEYEAQGVNYAAVPLDNNHYINLGYHKRIRLSNGETSEIHNGDGNREEIIANDLQDLRSYGCVYTKARADYRSKPIKGSTAAELNKTVYDRDTVDDFTSLKQLIVDVDTQDNRELKKVLKGTPKGEFEYEDFEHNSKLYRFQKAFDSFFEDIKYEGVEPINGDLDVLFNKHNNQVSIDNLSTGEKQIVYRGIYLLRNVGKLDGAAVMVDEPELSMHPKWQKRILKYFKDLFTDEQNKQKVQLFFATHSEYVLGEALKDQANMLVIVLYDNNGTIEKREIKTPLVLPTITASEINYAAFDVPSIDYHIALYGAIQSKYNKHSITTCDQFIQTQCAPYYVQSTHGVVTNYGGNTYNTLPTKIRNHIDHPDNPYTFTDDELKTSIVLMRDILENIP